MSWSNKKEAYDDGFDDGVILGLIISMIIGSLTVIAVML